MRRCQQPKDILLQAEPRHLVAADISLDTPTLSQNTGSSQRAARLTLMARESRHSRASGSGCLIRQEGGV